MILPDDILNEIRALSKPRMRFIHEFNAALIQLKNPPSFIPDVKKKLETKDAPKIIEVFEMYVESEVEFKEEYRRFVHGLSEDGVESLSSSEACRDAWKRVLRVLLYGEAFVAAEEARMMEVYD